MLICAVSGRRASRWASFLAWWRRVPWPAAWSTPGTASPPERPCTLRSGTCSAPPCPSAPETATPSHLSEQRKMLGDFFRSALPLLLLNMSTSAQLSFLLEPSFVPPAGAEAGSALEAFPYFGGRYLAVAASLNGGNVLAIFVRMLQQWMHQLGTGIPESAIWERLLAAGSDDRAAAPNNASSADKATPPPPDLVVTPTVFGERHLPGARASVSGIGPQSALCLGTVLRALCQGLARNLHTMMPREMLERAGVRRIVGTGKALTRNTCLQHAVQDAYGIPLELGGKGDAALGAALAVLAYAERSRAAGSGSKA
ncbi:hypothetical protein V5799_021979 [Amblyomma americanum]|uniref:Sedoheptulokinase-like protein n=1 Tax=Amblyomma americanum TaxID=6943 RepID=A0AAQ4FNE8_AMBAM